MGRDDWDRLNRGHAESRGLPFTFYDCPGLTVERLASEVRREVSHRGAKLVVVDYLQIMATPRGTSRNDDVADLTRRVKQLAGELHVPIILLSQVNRASERSGAPEMPTLAMLRDSGPSSRTRTRC